MHIESNQTLFDLFALHCKAQRTSFAFLILFFKKTRGLIYGKRTPFAELCIAGRTYLLRKYDS